MKQKLITLFMSAMAFAFILSAAAQNQVSFRKGRSLSSIVKKEMPNGLEKSTKDIIFYEDFPGTTLAGWTATGDGIDNWILSETNYAGGEPNEAWMAWSPEFTGQTRLESPVINTSGYTSLILSFSHLIYGFNATGYYVRVATTSDGGITWNEVWEFYWDEAGNYAAIEEIAIGNADVGSENFQFSFQFEGESPALEIWAIDNITLGDPTLLNDVLPSAILGLDGFIFEEKEVFVSTELNNYGTETVSFDVLLEISDGSNIVFESTKTVSDMAFGELATVDFDMWTAGEEGSNYSATVTTMLSGDENPDNDEMTVEFIVAPAGTYCIPSADCSAGDGFSDFAWAGIENYESGCSDGGYGDFTEMTAEVEMGYTYEASFASGYSDQMVSMWIDFNKDLEFSETERVLTDFYITESGVMNTVDINIPGNVSTGITIMRVGCNYFDLSSPDPCASFIYGEWEDYSVEITGAPVDLNAGVVSIDMDPIIPTGDVIPLATVKNLSTETVSFPVTMTVAGINYSSTVQVTDLGSGEEIQIEFDVWNASVGSYEIEVCTELVGDQIPENDCMDTDVSILIYDAGVTSINTNFTILSGDMTPVATVKNNGFETISFPVTLAIEGASYTSTKQVADLAVGAELILEFDVWTATPGDYNFEVETDLSNDDNPLNNSLEKEIYVLNEAPIKNVVGEEGTGTWCGWCIRGIVYMDSMQMKYPETWIGVAVHTYDPMENTDYLAGMNSYFTSYPSGVLNRGETIDPEEFEQYYLQEIERVAPANIQIENKQYNSTTKELTFTVTSEFVAPVTNYRFSAILIENGVTGTSEDYNQANYYSGGNYGPMAGYENLPNPIAAEDMVYEHVGRTVIGSFTGVEGSLPVSINAGETHSYEFTTLLADDWDENNVEVIGILLDYNTGRIENGAKSHLITSVSEQLTNQSFVMYPNPASDKVYIDTEENIDKVQLMNISGKLMFEQAVSGNRTEINTSKFDSGIYFIKVFSHNIIITRKLVIE